MEITQDLENSNSFDLEFEKEVELDDELEFITYPSNGYWALDFTQSAYKTIDNSSKYITNIQLPPPEC